MASGRSSQNNRTKNTAKTTAKKSGTTSKSRDTKGPSKKSTAARRTSGGNTRTAGGSKSRNQSGKKPTVVDTRTEQVTDYRVGQEIRICITAVISILLLLGLLGVGGRAGRFVSDALFGSFGLMAYVFPFLLFFAHAFFVANRTNQLIGRKMIGLFLCFLFLCAFMQLLTVGYIKVTDVGEYFRVAADDHTGGGFVGGIMVHGFGFLFGTVGAYVLTVFGLVVAAIVLTQKPLLTSIGMRSTEAAHAARERGRELRMQRKAAREAAREADYDDDDDDLYTDLDEDYGASPLEKVTLERRKNPDEDYDRPEEISSAKRRKNAELESRGIGKKTRRSAGRGKEKGSSMQPVLDEAALLDTVKNEIHAPAAEETVFAMPSFLRNASAGAQAPDSFSPGKPVGPDKLDMEISGIAPSSERDRSVFGEKAAAAGYDSSFGTQAEHSGKGSSKTRAGGAPDPVEWPAMPSFAMNNNASEKALSEKAFSEETFSGEAFSDEAFSGKPSSEEAFSGEAFSDEAYSGNASSEEAFSENAFSGNEAAADSRSVTDEEEAVPERGSSSGRSRKAAKTGAAEKKQEIASIQNMIDSSPAEKPEYTVPPIELLTPGKAARRDSKQYLMETAAKLQTTLANFGVNVKVVNVSCGPTVTRYELQPEMGVKVSRIINLQDDIKLNLATSEIRIEAPIPGKAAVGIEVPNKEVSPVMLHDIIDCPEFMESRAKLPFAVGKDIGGRPIVTDIEKMPHLLIAGATGSGKSVCINTLIMSILYRCTPDEVRMLMIDPKVVELKIYDGIPHLLIPVVTDAKKAAGALNWAVQEMTERYNKFARLPGVRDIKSYNERVKKMNRELDEAEQLQTLPRIIVIVDELADLMMVASSEVEDAICRLAQLARAAGIHLIIATQRPSVNVVTGLIKANMPSRIALAVTSGIDSRTILDMNGAEKLLGKGDMLFYPQGYPKPARVQGGYVSDEDITKVVEYLISSTDEVDYSDEVEEKISSGALQGNGSQAAAGDDSRDEYFADSGRLIIEKEKASIGMLQRAFKIGFNRAARIMDQLCDAGVVGGEEGTKPRKILMTMDEFEEMLTAE